ncbi:hypothetical protein HDF16_005800 [Granulicella aggregans]|uniref:Uncharacterized protein n=1 Tax=Granulicella aggregans TaxID=474949 RepID=A0A7W7ZK60_9BACT|nr:hypothetical protein [Granulicella aggregans]MBB5061064.1 hypothetical protein [Granulicella aggregans]
MKLTSTFSRRKLLVGGTAALALPSVAVEAATQKPSHSLSLADRALTVLTSSDAGFSDKIESLYPGLTRDSRFQTLAPLVLLISHDHGPALRALSMSWTTNTPTGTYETAMFRFAAPGSKRRARAGRTIASAQTDILRKGETRIVTPFFSLSPKAYRKLKDNWFNEVKHKEPSDFLFTQLQTATAVTAKVEAAVFGDRKFIGEDKHHLVSRLRARRNGEHDEALAVKRLLKAGASDTEISTMLKAHGSAQRPPNRGAKGWYLMSRKQQAQILHDKFTAMTRPSFAKLVHRLSKVRKTRIRPATI